MKKDNPKRCKTHMLKWQPKIGLNVVKTEGCTFYDKSGKSYVDFESGIWCANIGHTHPSVIEVLQNQSRQAVHMHSLLSNDSSEVLAEKLTSICQLENGYATFLSSGSEAVQLGLTVANILYPQGKLIALEDSYFAAYKYMRKLSENPRWHLVKFKQCLACQNKQCISECPILHEVNWKDFKILALEFGTSGGKVILPPKKLIDFIVSHIRENDGIILVNEVTTGFGRTGKWFAHHHYDVQPDIICMGKALGNGYPISAVLTSQSVGTHESLAEFKYDQSHQNDPLGCSVANAVIDTIQAENLISRSEHIGAFFKSGLEDLMHQSSLISEVRGKGIMLAIELKEKSHASLIFNMLLDKGFFVGVNTSEGLLRFYPPMTISEDNIRDLLIEMENCFDALKNTIQ